MLEIRGVVHGKTIELQEELGLPDGESVAVIVRRVLPQGEGIRRSAGGVGRCGRGVGPMVGRGVS